MPPKSPHTKTYKIKPEPIKWIICVLLVLLQEVIVAEKIDTVPDFEETSVTLTIDRIGTSEIPAVICNNTVYLSISGVFSFLKIKNTLSGDLDTISGFFLNPSDVFLVDQSTNTIKYGGKEIHLNENDIIKTQTNLFLHTRVFHDVFGLELTVSLKSLTVDFRASVELPVIREILQEEKRKFIRKQEGKIIADSAIARTYPPFHLGMADWSLNSTQSIHGGANLHGILNLGGYLAGGEANVGLNYYSNQPLLLREQLFRWRYVNNENTFLRQVTAGNISTPTISTIFNNILGFQVTNSPSIYRKYYGSYSLHDKTEPGWIVELYVNNVLVDYVKADASGFFTFEVPLSYGNTQIRLRQYGPWGEDRSIEKYIQVPFTFLPLHNLEYVVSAGILENGQNNLFYRTAVNYGLSRNLCIGGGNEYLSSISSGKNIPFLNTSFSFASNFLLTGEFAYGVKEDILASYRLPSGFNLELSYTHYEKNQTAILKEYREERKGNISLPLKVKEFTFFSRFSVDQIILPNNFQITMSDLIISAFYKMVSANIHSYGFFSDYGKPIIYSDVSLGIRLPKGFRVSPSVRYDHEKNKLTGLKGILEKPFCRNGFLNITYEQYPENKMQNLQVGLRYLFPYAQVMVNMNHYGNSYNISEAMSGSLIFNPTRSFIGASNFKKVGRGGITIIPFLDLNGNGKRDTDEPKVSGLTVKLLTGGFAEEEGTDSLTRIYDLEPYVNCILEVNSSRFENIAWQVRKKSFSVPVEPNMMRLVEIPVNVVGEVSGIVSLLAEENEENDQKLKISIYGNDANLVTSVYPGDDGFFSYLGLMPGNYTVMPDTVFLRANHMKCTPVSRKFSIKPGIDGDILNDMNFTIEAIKIVADSATSLAPDSTLKGKVEKSMEPTLSFTAPSPMTKEQADNRNYVIKMGTFKRKTTAESLKKKLCSKFRVKAGIVKSHGYYIVLVTGLNTHHQANLMLHKLKKNGYYHARIRSMRNGTIR